MDHFVEARVTSGRSSNAGEVEQREREDQAKLEWLRAAAKEGFAAGDRGDYTSLNSADDLDDFLEQIHDEVSAELATERKRAWKAPPSV